MSATRAPLLAVGLLAAGLLAASGCGPRGRGEGAGELPVPAAAAAAPATETAPAGDAETAVAESRSLTQALDFVAAAAVLDAAETRLAARGDALGVARVWRGRAFLLGRTAAPERALATLDRALAVFVAHGADADAAAAHIERADMLRELRRCAEARGEAERAGQLLARLQDAKQLARLEVLWSVVEAQCDNPQEALRRARLAVAAFTELADDQGLLSARGMLAWALQGVGNDEEAAAVYEQVLELAWRLNDQAHVQFALCNQAECRWRAGEPRPAEGQLRSAIATFETARVGAPSSAEERAQFLEREVSAYDTLIGLLVATGRGRDAFAVAERFRSRSALEMLALRQGAVREEEGELAQRRRRLLAELGAARLALEAGVAPAADSRRQVEELTVAWHALEGEAWRRLSGRREVADRQPPELAEVQGALREDEALVAYWVSDERTYAWAVTADGLKLVVIPVPQRELEEAVLAYLAPLRSRALQQDAALRGAEREQLARGAQLHRWLVESLPAPARQAPTMIVVPDGVLNALPFEALVAACDEEAAAAAGEDVVHAPFRACRYLGLERAVAYVPSARLLLALRQRRQAERPRTAASVLAMAPSFAGDGVAAAARGALAAPLARAAAEAELARAAFAAGEVLLGEHASEGAFKARAGAYRVLHLATHGLVDDELAASSGVLLAAGGDDDGLLQAAEVLELDLDAELVILSACRTARGRLRRAEGVVGLAQAFLVAGADSVAASLWDVDDATTLRFMELFHAALARGAGRAEALRQARAALFTEEVEGRVVFRTRRVARAHPRDWAAFRLLGAP